MGRFLSPLTMTKIGPYRWLLTDALAFESDRFSGCFVVPRGFQTDLASIPRLAWAVVPKVGAHDRAAVLHDAAYAGALTTAHGRRVRTVKHVADDLFAEALKADGVNPVLRAVMVTAVRAYGLPALHPTRVGA